MNRIHWIGRIGSKYLKEMRFEGVLLERSEVKDHCQQTIQSNQCKSNITQETIGFAVLCLNRHDLTRSDGIITAASGGAA
jgi:triosephosphate isomerase